MTYPPCKHFAYCSIINAKFHPQRTLSGRLIGLKRSWKDRAQIQANVYPMSRNPKLFDIQGSLHGSWFLSRDL
jgi:hypothetical protein